MKKVIATVCICMLICMTVSAEGYQVNAQSTKQAGMGHVGAAMKLGAESMHFNPAGLGFIENQVEISAGVTGIFTDLKYRPIGGDTKLKANNDPSTPMYVYAGFKIYDNLSAGISLNNPYGSAINWGKNWAGAGLVQDISLKAFSIQPTVSYRFLDRVSVGAGLMIMFGDFSLSRALVPAGKLEGLKVLENYVPGVTDFANKYKDTPAASATLSGNTTVKVGYNIGVMFDITKQFTVGISYRSRVDMHVPEGNAELNYVNELEYKAMAEKVNPILQSMGQDGITVPPLDKGTFDASLPLPSNLNIGLTYKANEKWLVSGEVQFVGWGAYDVLKIAFTEEVLAGGYNIDATKNYKNSRIYRLGTQFNATSRFDFRLGTYFDQSPVKEEYLNPETPSMNKWGITTGCTFRPLPNLGIDFAFTYVTGFGRNGSYTDDLSGAVFSGHYNATAYMPAIGLSYYFK
ncbi:MAG: outer membrane protein transport protein [Tannerellaceae bacterium]|nr:outer membrane protein transport protein [Tannerellaceae bacterium]